MKPPFRHPDPPTVAADPSDILDFSRSPLSASLRFAQRPYWRWIDGERFYVEYRA